MISLPSAESPDEDKQPARRHRTQRWVIVGGTTLAALAMAIAFGFALRRGKSPASAPSNIDWHLSLLSHNSVEFRPSVALGRERPER